MKHVEQPGAADPYLCRIEAILAGLGIPAQTLAARGLVLCPEAREVVVAETSEDGRVHRLVPDAAAAWRAMRAAAESDGVRLRIVSAFRSVDRQAEIVRAKLDRGEPLERILAVSAPPGYSEHHSGRAIDITTDGVRPLEPEFEGTSAYRWLMARAAGFGFSLSFPRGNPYGYAYEPWHWFHDPSRAHVR